MIRTAKDRVPGSYAVVFEAQYASLIPNHLKAQPKQWVGRRVLIEGVNSGCSVPYAQVTDKDGNEACIDLIHLNPDCPQTFDETAPAGADVPEGATHELRGLYYKARDGVLVVYLPLTGWHPSGNNPADMLDAVALNPATPTQAARYIVWSPEGQTPPRKKHRTPAQAKAVARTMAQRHPGQTFHVCALVGGATVETKTTERVVVEQTQELKEF